MGAIVGLSEGVGAPGQVVEMKGTLGGRFAVCVGDDCGDLQRLMWGCCRCARDVVEVLEMCSGCCRCVESIIEV